MADPQEAVDATELISVALSADCKCLRLRLRDRSGRTVSVTLPANWMNTMLSAMPQQVESGIVHALDNWSMDRSNNGQDVILTLRTAEGLAVSFAAKPWQVEGMATIATYGSTPPIPPKTMH